MSRSDPIRDLQVFVDERWAVAQPKFYPSIAEGPRVPAEATPSDAAWFLDCVTGRGERLETIVGWAAVGRFCGEFGWPRELLPYEALDILVLEEPCAELPARMPVQSARSHVGVEAKATPKMLAKLLAGMRACQNDGLRHSRSDHVKCTAIAVLRPRLFLGVAAAETWRLFNVVERDGRAVLGDELPDLDRLRFAAMSERA